MQLLPVCLSYARANKRPHNKLVAAASDIQELILKFIVEGNIRTNHCIITRFPLNTYWEEIKL